MTEISIDLDLALESAEESPDAGDEPTNPRVPEWWKPGRWKTEELARVELEERTSKTGRKFYTYVATDRYGRRCQMRRVTTILRSSGKEGLSWWAAGRCADEAAAGEFPAWTSTREQYQEDVQAFRERIYRAHEEALGWCANRGSRAHRMMEFWMRGRDLTTSGLRLPLELALSGKLEQPDKLHRLGEWEEEHTREWRFAYQSLLKWVEWWWKFVNEIGAQGFRIREILIEHSVADMELGYAGTADILVICECGAVFVVDWKSSKDIHPEYDLQIAAYVNAAAKNPRLRIDVERVQGLIIRSHTKMPWEVKEEDDPEEEARADFASWWAFRNSEAWRTAFTSFGACLHLYEWKHQREMNALPKFGGDK